MKKTNQWDPAKPAAENAAAVLPVLAGTFFSSGKELAAATEITPDALHAFRLSAKRFRYTLELFRNCYGPSLEEKLESLASVQQVLGELSDCAATRTLLNDERFAGFSLRQEFFSHIDAILAEKAAAFVKLWRSTFDTEAEQRRWIAYLHRPAARMEKKKGEAKPVGKGGKKRNGKNKAGPKTGKPGGAK